MNEQSSASHPSGTPSPAGKRVQHITAEWRGEQRFETGRPHGVTAVFDGNARAGQSPVDALLSALAACSGIDVVEILAKRRTPATRLAIEVVAHRREEAPRRLTRVEAEYRIDGEGIDVEHAERAVALAFGKYCSVSASLAGDINASTTLVLNGERRPAVRHTLWSAEHSG
jgi:putative redox protein